MERIEEYASHFNTLEHIMDTIEMEVLWLNLDTLIKEYQSSGYKYVDASSKVCQDIILLKISKSPFLSNITVKGGVVMHNISNDKRRATRDIDLDFIRYSLDDESIRKFINGLNKVSDGITLEIVNNKIEELNQQDYKGKRVELKLVDSNNHSIVTKLDLGVHKNIDVEQVDLVFNLEVLNNNIVLLANSKEQIFVEKLKSLLRFGAYSTRYKDILDFYFLINNTEMDRDKLYLLIIDYIFLDQTLFYNNMIDIVTRLAKIFKSARFIRNFNNIRNNWLELPINEVTKSILDYMDTLVVVEAS